MAAGVPARLTPAQGRRFAFTVGGAFLALAALAWWRESAVAWRVLAALGGALAVAGAAVPGRLGPVYRGWMALAHAISRVMTPVAMAIIYFGVLTPVALVMRAAGHAPLVHRAQDGSFWRPAPSGGRADLHRWF